jgi:catechol 2,3-dioxygenase-like lactoylglutathione lyase family enzyme
MAILGIESVRFRVEDMALSTRFFDDLGLVRAPGQTPDQVRYALAEGSSVLLQKATAANASGTLGNLYGPQELIWGVEDARALDGIADDLAKDRPVERSGDGALRTRDDAGIPIGFRVYSRKKPQDAEQGENGLTSIKRRNRLRKWYDHARPQVLHHTVWGVPNVDEAVAFYTKRLGFRVTDMIRNVGVFMRCEGRPDHHNLFLHRGQKPFFNHVALGVENIDELMTGVNEMQRKGWTSKEGLGRHRMTSIIFCYFECPGGGSVEYMCDSDYLTDEWEPNLWDPGFANHHWLAQGESHEAAAQGSFRKLPKPLPSFSEASRLSVQG